MKKRELLRRIEELEQRVVALEARPHWYYTPWEPVTITTPQITFDATTTAAPQPNKTVVLDFAADVAAAVERQLKNAPLIS